MAAQLSLLLKHVFPKEHLWKVKLFQSWGDIMGTLKDKVRIEKLDGGLLILGVCHPAWAQELFLLSNVIKKKINLLLQEEKIKNIRFYTTDFDKKPTTKKTKNKHISCKNPETIVLNGQENALLEKIKKDDLRFELEKYYRCCKRWKEESRNGDKVE